MKKPLNVLIVEDSEDDARLMVRELEQADHPVVYERVETEAGLRQALAQEHWHLTLCDFSLPGFNGHTALRIVKESGRDLPFIYVSGKMGEALAVECMQAGAHDYVMKADLRRPAPAVKRELHQAEIRRLNRQLEAGRERLILELQTALLEVKRLSGLLHLCAGCKRIHKPDGSWQAIEAYLAEHSEATFSHGICPDCASRLYPGVALNGQGSSA